MFSLLQKARIKLHLNQLSPDRWVQGLTEPSDFVANTYTVETELIVVGDPLAPVDPGTPDNDFEDGTFFYQGVRIAEPQSLLWQCEVAYRKMGPFAVDASLLVQKAGEATLRRDELMARRELYDYTRRELGGALGYPVEDYDNYINVRYRRGNVGIATGNLFGAYNPLNTVR